MIIYNITKKLYYSWIHFIRKATGHLDSSKRTKGIHGVADYPEYPIIKDAEGHNVLQVDNECWKKAQAFELKFAASTIARGDDYNQWWFERFNEYQVLHNKHFSNVLEVGCGPHTNIRLLLGLISFDKLYLEDPLIENYLKLKQKERCLRFFWKEKPVIVATIKHHYQAITINEKLEELSLDDNSMDLIICINVLDHVQDVNLCLKQMLRILNTNGILNLAQDLSNDEDYKRCPESWEDMGHPIKIDDIFLDSYLADLTIVFKKILPRGEGRNPKCHYGTYLFIGENKKENSS